MVGQRRFPPEEVEKLEDERRRLLQPAGPLVELVAGLGPARVLDIGAGVGYFALPLLQRLAGLRLVALDVEQHMLDGLAERAAAQGIAAGRIEPLRAAADRGPYPLAAASVDAALAVNLLHELDDRPALLGEVRRVLAPGGHLIACDWDPRGRDDFGPPEHHRLDPASVRAELQAAGFGDISGHDLYADLYTLQARSPAA